MQNVLIIFPGAVSFFILEKEKRDDGGGDWFEAFPTFPESMH